MATLAWPTLDQHIRLEAVAIDGRLVTKNLVTTRAGGIAAALAGRVLADVPTLLPRLFPLCGAAHAIASLAAIETALRIELPAAQTAFRDLLLLAEHGAAVAWRILMDWPPLIGEPAQVRACADVRRAAAAINAGAEGGQWARIGGATLRPERDELRRVVRELALMLNGLFPEAEAPSFPALEAKISARASTPARLISIARRELANYGAHDLPRIAAMDTSWFASRLASQPDFSDAPTRDGVPAEVGPLAAQRHPLVAGALTQWGPTLATRLLAAALDAHVVAERLLRALDPLSDADPAAADLTRTGRGVGVEETARGPLAYYVETADGRVRTLRSVAPTEWNFHGEGPFMAALATAPRVADPVFAARLLAASFDPCVPLTIDLASGDRRPAHAEPALHA